jgi:hypothetical protein
VAGTELKVALTYCLDGARRTLYASARTKAEAEQAAALEAITLLAQQGIRKAPPEVFLAATAVP